MAKKYPYSNTLLLLFFILLSLLLHLLMLSLGPQISEHKEPSSDEPTYVEFQPIQEVRETARVIKPIEKEVKTHRLGEANQEVEEEQSPEGYDLEDSAPAMPQMETQKQPQEQPQPEETAPASKPEAENEPAKQKEETLEPQSQPRTEPMPKLEQLLQSSNHAAADIARETRVKHRPDVARGEAVWLNMKHDLLFSFFARFKKGIYAVWNYPHESTQRGEQGTALLEIIINRDGSIEDVNLLSGTEFERLNREAIAAVFKAAPYGNLPDSYPEEQLRIKAYFHYQIGGGKRIFGK